MQGLFNRQQPFIASLFSKGPFTTQKDIITVCCRRVATTRCGLHHGKGVTFKLQGGKGSGRGCDRTVKCNSKNYRTSSWLKKTKSGKSSGSSCTVTKNRKGKIIFRVTRQSLPKVNLEVPTSTFRNSINNVFESKLVRTRRAKHGLNDRLLADATQPVDKLSLPQFKDTSIVNMGHRKNFKNDDVMKRRRSETQIRIKQNQDHERSAAKNVDSFSSNPIGGIKTDSYTEQSHGGRNTLLGAKDEIIPRIFDNKMVFKAEKDNSQFSTTRKKLTKARTKPLIFSSTEMLFSYANSSDSVGFNGIMKLENGLRGGVRKPEKQQVKDGEYSEGLLTESSSKQPLEENIDSTIKLFMDRRNNGGNATKRGSTSSDAVKNSMKLENYEEALVLEGVERKCVSQAPQVSNNRSIGDCIPRVMDTKSELTKVENCPSDIGRSEGLNQTLFGKIGQGDKADLIAKDNVKSPQRCNLVEKRSFTNPPTPKFLSMKRGDNVTLHRHMDFKRPIKEEKVEFDTTVIEQEGKKITRIKPKHSNLRKKSSNRNVTAKKSRVQLDSITHITEKAKTPRKFSGNTKSERPTIAKTAKRHTDNYVIPEDGEKIISAEIDPFIPKMNSQRLNSLKVDEVVIQEDGRTIKERDYDLTEWKTRQNAGAGKQSLAFEGLVIPQDGRRFHPLETETESFTSKSESWTIKINPKNNSNYKVDIQSDHRTSKNEAISLKTEAEQSKSSPGIASRPLAATMTNEIGVEKIMIRNAVKNNEDHPREPIGLNWRTQITAESSVPKPNELRPSKEKKSWKSLTPLYSPTSEDPGLVVNKNEPLQSSFADICKTVSGNTGISTLKDGNSQWSRKVNKMKYRPQTEYSTPQTVNSTLFASNQEMQPITEPKINVTSESATAVVLKSRIVQPTPESVRVAPSQTQSMPNGIATTNNPSKPAEASISHVGMTDTHGRNVPVNTMTRDPQQGFVQNVGVGANPSFNTPTALGTQFAGHLSLSNKTDSSCMNSCTNTINNDLNVNCNMPKASFPPPCNACTNNPSSFGINTKNNDLNFNCNMTKASFPPPCNVCSNNSSSFGGNQVSCSTDGCNTKNVFPPPCNVCETTSGKQPEAEAGCTNCPTCKPEFPPPCSSNTCPPIAQRPENSCYDPCKIVEKSRTHTVIDIDSLPRPPTPIRIDCLPKSKPCFPPQCPETCKSSTNTCCEVMHKTKKEQVSFADWRAYMNYNYWMMKCLLRRVFDNFLTLLKTHIMHISEYRMKKRCCQEPSPPSKECQVIQSAVFRPKRTVGLGVGGFNRNTRHGKSMQQQVRPIPKNKVRKKVQVVKSVKKSVLDERSKRAILKEEERRKFTAAKANPALAYSEVLNIVFSQKK